MEFWGIYRYILTGVERVTLISCHEQIKQVVADKFGIAKVDVILIPSEYRHSHQLNTHQTDNDHYPYHFNRILAELCVNRGDLFLVAAGFLGKIYCNEIKKKGGIGIDIGSIADMWLGHNTRFEHEHSRSVGVKLDLDLLRKKTFPAYKKVVRKPYYRSNYYADMNIYKEHDESLIKTQMQRKKLLNIGHPRCGSRYTSQLFKSMGLDISHESFGNDGICSWLFTVKDLNMPNIGNYSNITPDASYHTEFDYIVSFVRNPFAAMPSVIAENCDPDDRSYNFRRNHIINALGIDIDDYTSDLERAVASYLYWYKIVQSRKPHIILKIEDCVSDMHNFLLKNDLIKSPIDISRIQIGEITKSTSSQELAKPCISTSDYSTIALHLKEELNSFCDSYGY